MKIYQTFPKISDIVFVKKADDREVMGIVIGKEKKIPGIGYTFLILTSKGVKEVLRENIYKKKNAPKV